MTPGKEEQLLNQIEELTLDNLRLKAYIKDLTEKLENIKVVNLYNLSDKK